MMRRTSGLPAFGLLLLAALPVAATAQTAVTVTGHVSAASMPVRGASVRIDQLDLGGTTDADGRYSFIVPSARVQGQTVTRILVAWALTLPATMLLSGGLYTIGKMFV